MKEGVLRPKDSQSNNQPNAVTDAMFVGSACGISSAATTSRVCPRPSSRIPWYAVSGLLIAVGVRVRNVQPPGAHRHRPLVHAAPPA
jgi:hypothetical protein